jgi:membrane protein
VINPMQRARNAMFRPIFTKQFWVDLYGEISEDNVYNGAAALAYYLTLSIFPAFIVIMTVIPYLPIEDVDQAIMDLLHEALPQEAAELLEGTVAEVTQEQRGGLLSVGILITLWTVSTGMYAIMQQLNITYDIKEGRSFITARAVALVLSVTFVALVIGGFSLIVLGGVMEDWLFELVGENEVIVIAFRVFRWIVIVLALLLAFALVYRFAPNVEQKFRFITPGSVLGVVLLVAASLAFTVYIRNFGDYSATYGSIGAVIILMLWLYIAGLVILVGSEINALIEHYSPEGKRKGEKEEDGHAGGSLHGEGTHGERAATPRPMVREPSRPSLIAAAAFLLLKALRRPRS